MSINYKDALSDVFEGAPEKVAKVSDLLDAVKKEAREEAEASVRDALVKSGAIAKVSTGTQLLNDIRGVMRNGGVHPRTGKKWSFKDAAMVDVALAEMLKSKEISPEDFGDLVQSQGQPALYFKQAVVETIRDAYEPLLTLTPLMQTVRTDGVTMQINYPYMSSFHAGDLTVIEKGEYKEGTMQFAGSGAIMVGKHGIMVSMTEEAIRYCAWDIWSMYIRHAGRALARHKEEQVVNKIFANGEDFFDNTTIGGRKTTGRDIYGAYNGTITGDDIWTMYADLIDEGYIPDLILVHPMAWRIFAQDPVLRNFAYLNGMPSGLVASAYRGQPAATERYSGSGLLQERRVSEPANTASTYTPLPSYLPFGAMRIIVTPHVDYDFTNDTTTIYMCDSRDLGIIAIDQEVTTADWDDPLHDVKSTKFVERYGIGTANNYRSIRKAKGVVVAKAYDFSLSSIVSDIGELPTSELVVS